MEESMRENVASLLPVVTEYEAPFWNGLQDGKLMVQECKSCGHKQFPPSPVCTECLSEKVEWVEASGKASLWSKVEFNKAYLKPYPDVPYAVAVARLEEGPLVEGRFSAENYKKVPIDAELKVTFVDTQDGTKIVEFVPVND